MHNRRWLFTLGAIVVALLVLSGVHPHERSTWWMEVAPIFIVAPILALTARRFPLTSMLYVLIACHAVILLVGGAYTYARVPLGFWAQDAFHLSRNPYDKLGHFAQGSCRRSPRAKSSYVRASCAKGCGRRCSPSASRCR